MLMPIKKTQKKKKKKREGNAEIKPVILQLLPIFFLALVHSIGIKTQIKDYAMTP